jgi:hypothetical protein
MENRQFLGIPLPDHKKSPRRGTPGALVLEVSPA